ncbi:MAG TPA: hydroxymethylbilane synthase, partial [Urbifossiella sp.]|nr:hydroxymethylbilane synthase [Urbifossiella sp.]
MNASPLRLGTRGSPLALWQANHIADRLRPVVAPQPIALVLIETHGDRDRSTPLAAMGGFGVFTKAIQTALRDGRADAAVHSLKDLPTIPEPGLELVAVPPRGPTGDAFVSVKHRRFDALPKGAVIGTSSLRRRAMLANRRPDLTLIDLRGNVETRLRKLEENDLDAIILAEAGLVRLGLADRITEVLDPAWMLPAVGQGAIGLECRADDEPTKDAVRALTDPDTFARVTAERAMLATLGGGC